MPGPWRPRIGRESGCDLNAFQSQPRCQAPGDHDALLFAWHALYVSISTEMPGPWRLLSCLHLMMHLLVSISTEMPGPWRQEYNQITAKGELMVSISTEMPGPWRRCCANEKNDAAIVSISTEMPGPWRQCIRWRGIHMAGEFQSQPRCQAPGDIELCHGIALIGSLFQSQPRCQAPGDSPAYLRDLHV